MAKHKLSTDRVSEYNAKIQDLESKALAAIQANREDLALEVAEAISTLTSELDAEQKHATEFGGYAENMRKRSEEHTSELQSLMRISYAVFCLKNKKHKQRAKTQTK